jgi:hypothetical protein
MDVSSAPWWLFPPIAPPGFEPYPQGHETTWIEAHRASFDLDDVLKAQIALAALDGSHKRPVDAALVGEALL